MIFNGHDFKDLFIIARKSRDILPDITNITQQAPGMAGSHFVREEIGPRYLGVEVTIEDTTRQDLRLKILEASSKLKTAEPKPLEFKDEGLIYYAKLDGGTELNEILEMGEGTLNFICPNPYKHGEEEIEGIGSAFNNEGTYTPFILSFELTGAIESLEIELNGNKVMELIDDYQAGDTIEINTSKENRSIKKNGENNKEALTIDSNFMDLEPGENTINITGATVTGGQVAYTKRWL